MKSKYRKKRFGKCIGCFYGYSKCKASKHRIPRKHKKVLALFEVLAFKSSFHACSDFSICELDKNYSSANKYFKLIPFFKKYHKEISIIVKSGTESSEGIYLNEKGRLCFQWENDNGLYTETGLMPFCYTKKQAGDTWAYSAMHELWEQLFKGQYGDKLQPYINNDTELLDFIKTHPIPKEWVLND